MPSTTPLASEPPLIATLLLDDTAQARFDALRRAHFPPDRLRVGAHVTLFHALPGAAEADISAAFAEAARVPAFVVTVSGLRFLGRGVAFALSGTELRRLRDGLRARFAHLLTVQDAQPWQPHVTVQNKVPPSQARALHAALSASFAPWQAMATGLGLWRYLGGPWEFVRDFPFQVRPSAHSGGKDLA